jgi:hypothetical protein
MVIVVNEVHVTVAVEKLEEKKGLPESIRRVLVDGAKAALAIVLAKAILALGVWVFQTLSNQSPSSLLCISHTAVIC